MAMVCFVWSLMAAVAIHSEVLILIFVWRDQTGLFLVKSWTWKKCDQLFWLGVVFFSSHLFSWGRHLVLLRSHPLFNLTTIVLAAFWSHPMRRHLRCLTFDGTTMSIFGSHLLFRGRKRHTLGNAGYILISHPLSLGRHMCNYKQLIGSPSFNEILHLVHSEWHTYNTCSHER